MHKRVTHHVGDDCPGGHMKIDRAEKAQHGRCNECGLRLPAPMHTGPCPSCDNYRARMVPEPLAR